jgi:hypothetical protein
MVRTKDVIQAEITNILNERIVHENNAIQHLADAETISGVLRRANAGSNHLVVNTSFPRTVNASRDLSQLYQEKLRLAEVERLNYEQTFVKNRFTAGRVAVVNTTIAGRIRSNGFIDRVFY